MRRLSVPLAVMTIAVSTTPAFAARFSPPGTDVTIAGSLLIQPPGSAPEFQCKVTFTGPITHDGKLKIRKAAFCHKLPPYGLPWIWIATQAHNPPAAVGHMAFNLKNGFDCGTIDEGLGFFNEMTQVNFFAQVTSKGCFIRQGLATVSPAIRIVH